MEKESYIEHLESSLEELKERLNLVEETLASKEEAKDEADKEVIKLSDELKEQAINYIETLQTLVNQLSLHDVSKTFYTIEEYGQGSMNRGVMGNYRTKQEAEENITDSYYQSIKEHVFN